MLRIEPNEYILKYKKPPATNTNTTVVRTTQPYTTFEIPRSVLILVGMVLAAFTVITIYALSKVK